MSFLRRIVPIAPLDRKLLRDTRRWRSQLLAITSLLALGVAIFVAFYGCYVSLERAIVERIDATRQGDLLFRVERAPLGLTRQIEEISGVRAVSARFTAMLSVLLADEPPIAGRLVSLPKDGRPRLNDLDLTAGRWPDPSRDDEILVLDGFARAHGLHPRDRVELVIGGLRQKLTIAGLAVSPETLYGVAPGSFFPDPRRWVVVWGRRHSFERAAAQEGAFNEVVVAVEPGAPLAEVTLAAEDLLAPFGRLATLQRSEQRWFLAVEAEIEQVRVMAFAVAGVFLLVAAFLLTTLLRRIVLLERCQIATLRALGASRTLVARQFILLAVAIAAVGAACGALLGSWLCTRLLQIYEQQFSLGGLGMSWSWPLVVGALGLSLFAALGGSLSAVVAVLRSAPAEGLRAETPRVTSRSLLFWIAKSLPPRALRVCSELFRKPLRSAGSIFAIATATALVTLSLAIWGGTQELVRLQFEVAHRHDLHLTFREPVSQSVRGTLRSLPGVMAVELRREIPVCLMRGSQSRETLLRAWPEVAELERIATASGQIVSPDGSGLWLSARLARELELSRGDRVHVEILEGGRRTLELSVTSVMDDLVGETAAIETRELHRLLGESVAVTSALLQVDPSERAALDARLEQLSMLAAAVPRADTMANLQTNLLDGLAVLHGTIIGFALLIGLGVVDSTGRMSTSERSRELASLRVLGFTTGEVQGLATRELAALAGVAVPIGLALGVGLTAVVLEAVGTSSYRLPNTLDGRTLLLSTLVMAGSTALALRAVRSRVGALEPARALAVREF